MAQKRLFILILISYILFCFCGCELVDVDGNPVTRPSPPETMEWDKMDLDPELHRALDEKNSCVLWRVPEDFQIEGDAAVRPYETLDCAELWPELKEFVFPSASLRSETQEDGACEMFYSDGTRSFSVQLNSVSLFLEGLTREQATDTLEQINAYLIEKTGYIQAQWSGPAPEAQWLSYGMLIDGIPVDVKMDSPLPVSCVFVQPNGKLILWNPILPGEPSEHFDLGDCMSVAELQSTAETIRETGIPMVTELNHCSLIYYFDEDTKTLRPGWSLTGNGFHFETGERSSIEMLVDAINGKVKRVS